MIRKSPYILIALSLIFSAAQSQTKFVTAGKIEYERKTNQYAFMEDGDAWDEALKKVMSKFVTYYYDLDFKGRRMLYKPGRDPEIKQVKYWGVLPSDNTIFTNLDSNKSIIQRNISGDSYLLTDSLRNIDWKISTEIRKIAGFDCRKAVGRIMDSVVVIAFYTDEIVTPGGPESFTGLPGMIMGLAVPRLHTTWYATKLQLVEVTEKDLAAPRKGKKMTGDDYRTQVKSILKNWGEYGKKQESQFLF